MSQRGFTFVELIMGIVVMSIAVIGVLMAMQTTVARSADPMIAHQGIAIAESYMEEILTKNFTGTSPPCPARATHNSVDCYEGLVEPPTNQGGTPLAPLSAYQVAVAVGGSCGLGLGAGEKRVAVTVSHDSGFTYRLDGCISDY